MHIEYTASNGKNKVSAPTAREATQRFLAQFKNRSFYIQEWRDGRHFFEFCGDTDPEKNCFHISFNSRKEAQDFVDKALKLEEKPLAISA